MQSEAAYKEVNNKARWNLKQSQQSGSLTEEYLSVFALLENIRSEREIQSAKLQTRHDLGSLDLHFGM